MCRFARAIAKTPASTFASGLTTASLGAPEFNRTVAQHAEYCRALEAAGLEVTVLDPDTAYPDSTFVEDTAVVAGGGAIVSRPGASSRLGETSAIRNALSVHFDSIDFIESPGTLDGGDVCEAGERAYIGLSHRTNADGAAQLQEWFAKRGIAATVVDIRSVDGILHLKSGMAYLGDALFVAIEALLPRLSLQRADVVRVASGEEYAANCLRVNGTVLLPAGYGGIRAEIERRGLTVTSLDVSEFRKMDGGLSCLSLRF